MTKGFEFSRRSMIAGSALLLGAGAPALGKELVAPQKRPPFPIEDDNGRPVDPPPPGYYDVARRSGPGLPVTAETERGGWVTSEAAVDRKGVRYKGPGPAPANLLPWANSDSARVVTQGLIPPVKPLLHLHLRDTIVCLGGDGNYYMTGSTGDDIWKANDGVELWRSPDLKQWDYLGLVWSIERDGVWEKQWSVRKGDYFRAVWAPEIHFINGNYYICHSISRSGIAVLRSTTGKAEGPYVHAFSPDKPLRNGIDATLFGDDDGAVYLTYAGAFEMVRLKPDLSGYDGDWQPIALENPDPDPAHHNKKCVHRGFKDIGFEGATMFKHDGTYYLGAVDRFVNNRYSFALATSDKPFGPYRDRYESVACGGGGNIFKDKEGRWWCTIFGNDDEAPFREKPGIVPARMDEKGRLVADFTPREV
ncbi:glycoside hydrolase [Novosphingobium barchaimii LL02]|uniref:Glycoside hydrolase n=1 Tax=Novosphingobium barchaimii LL02 TaxID=1114963 RepID=A0A0J7XYF2_9SPHN|nr:family 43 glycosylhydrolase [Novosphingobium barchaimii]KMS56298.1 glycoside hydrolase [Novosphingobium barchaimii LL02]